MQVVQLVKNTNKETVETLEWMLYEARHGRLKDFLSSFRDMAGEEHAAFTGLYKVDSAKALMALMRMSSILVGGD